MALSNTLAELRKKAKLTQSELGEKLSISAQAISKWENGLSEPDIDTLKKLASIYGIAISDILEENKDAAVSEAPVTTTPKPLYDVFMVNADENNALNIMDYLTDMLGLDTVSASSAVFEHPYLIASGVDAEKSSHISAALSMLGATVSLEPTTDVTLSGNSSNAAQSTDKPWESEKAASAGSKRTIHKRFVVANVTAAIPAIAVMIFIFVFSSLSTPKIIIEDTIFAVLLGYSIYSLIFLAWYPTFTRKFFAPISFLTSGGILCFALACIMALPWLLISLVIAPVNYIFAIKTRIKRMKEENPYDDIFLNLE